MWRKSLLLGTVLLLCTAAVTPNSQVTCQAVIGSGVSFVQGTDVAGTYKTIFTGGTNGSKIFGVWVTTNDGSLTHLATVQQSNSTSSHCSPQSSCLGGAAVTIPVSSGFANGAPAINMLSPTNWPGLPVDALGNPFLSLTGATLTIEATFATALTASTNINFIVQGCNY